MWAYRLAAAAVLLKGSYIFVPNKKQIMGSGSLYYLVAYVNRYRTCLVEPNIYSDWLIINGVLSFGNNSIWHRKWIPMEEDDLFIHIV